MSKNKKLIIALIALLVLAGAALLAYFSFLPSAQEGSKTVFFHVTHGDGSGKDFTVSSDGATLGDALKSRGIIQGEEGPYGMFVTAVDGEAAVEELHQWWCFYKDGEMLPAGVDDTVIADGEHYEASLETY